MLKYEDYISQIKEGLIITQDISLSIDELNLYLTAWKADFSINRNTNNTISIDVNISNYINGTDLIDNILSLSNNLGYFPSTLNIELLNGNKNTLKWCDNFFKANNISIPSIKGIRFTIEQKFDTGVNFNKLYHVTPNPNLSKILKIGLCPRSINKLTYHTERIYLSYYYNGLDNLTKRLYYTNPKIWIKGTPEFEKWKNSIKTWSLLEINLPADTNIKLFSDPNYSTGCYTHNNIPNNLITHVDNIVIS